MSSGSAGQIRVAVIDDEPIARQLVTMRLAPHVDTVVVGEAGAGAEAIALILSARPDLVFLDIELPGTTGFGILDAVADQVLPEVVFVTAHDDHALRAFDYYAIDYILKPFDQGQLDRAMARARERLRKKASPEGVAAYLSNAAATPATPTGPAFLRRIPIRVAGRYVLLTVDTIDWVEARGNNVRFHSGPQTLEARMTLGELERRLDPSRFARIHRGTLVNLDRVHEVIPDAHGDCAVVLKDRTELRGSRVYRSRLVR